MAAQPSVPVGPPAASGSEPSSRYRSRFAAALDEDREHADGIFGRRGDPVASALPQALMQVYAPYTDPSKSAVAISNPAALSIGSNSQRKVLCSVRMCSTKSSRV
jgi:hypothetical protein